MALRVIKSKQGLPKWFNLRKYEESQAFEIDDWYTQLHWRFRLFATLNGKGIYTAIRGRKGDSVFWEALDELRAYPISPKWKKNKLRRNKEAIQLLNSGSSTMKFLLDNLDISENIGIPIS